MTFTKYITRLRIAKTFRKTMGVTPSEYRGERNAANAK